MKKMNWILRFKNKPVLFALAASVVALIYQVLGILGITPSVSESEVTNIVGLVINLLVMLGIVTDPTTAGVKDTTQVMEYTEPRKE